MKQDRAVWNVVTLPEAAEIWKLSRSTIIWQIWKGSLAVRKAKGAWLISYKSMCKNFGKPKGVLVDESIHAVIHLPEVWSGDSDV